MAHYTIDYDRLEDVTQDAEEHLEANEWRADSPHYEYDNAKVWDGGFGIQLIFDKADNKYYFEG